MQSFYLFSVLFLSVLATAETDQVVLTDLNCKVTNTREFDWEGTHYGPSQGRDGGFGTTYADGRLFEFHCGSCTDSQGRTGAYVTCGYSWMDVKDLEYPSNQLVVTDVITESRSNAVGSCEQPGYLTAFTYASISARDTDNNKADKFRICYKLSKWSDVILDRLEIVTALSARSALSVMQSQRTRRYCSQNWASDNKQAETRVSLDACKKSCVADSSCTGVSWSDNSDDRCVKCHGDMEYRSHPDWVTFDKEAKIAPEQANWPGDFGWHYAGAIPGQHCTWIGDHMRVWHDNFLCVSGDKANPGLRYSPFGQIAGMRCININEPGAPRRHTWHDNHFCWPNDSPYEFQWSFRGPIAGLDCLQVYEPGESRSHGWTDNYLCGKRTGLPDGSSCNADQVVKCTSFPCVDLRLNHDIHNIMSYDSKGDATIVEYRSNWTPGRKWTCECDTCESNSLVGSWNCEPGFHGRTIVITSNYADNFFPHLVNHRENDWAFRSLDVCKLPNLIGTFDTYNAPYASISNYKLEDPIKIERITATSDSSIFHGEAYKAVDGNSNGGVYEDSPSGVCTHTRNGDSWITLDLVSSYEIDRMEFVGRRGSCRGCYAQSSGWNIHIGNSGTASDPLCKSLVDVSGGDVITVTCDSALTGHYITITSSTAMVLCEVDVYGRQTETGCDTSVRTDGMWYGPLDLPGHGRTVATPEGCRQRCAAIPDCVYFNNFPNGGCHVAGEHATLQSHPGNPTAASGAVRCPNQGMTYLGVGYCTSGYYAGWDGKGIDSQEACNRVCLTEQQCTYAAYSAGRTCSRYNENSCTLNSVTNHITYAKQSNSDVAAEYFYGDVNSAQWCSEHEDRMNICDGDINRCWQAGIDLCDSEGDSCFGVMINAGWTQAFRGVKLCLSNVMADKGDWLTRMKISSAVEESNSYYSYLGNGWCTHGGERIGLYAYWVQNVATTEDNRVTHCEQLCDEDASCLGYMTEDGTKCQLWPGTTYGQNFLTADGTDTEGRNHCWLKRNSQNQFEAIDARKACEVNHQGIRFLSGAPGFNFETCKQKCVDTIGCVAIDYYRSIGRCNIYDRACTTPKIWQDGASSWRRVIPSRHLMCNEDALAYCNSYPELKKALCGGATCSENDRAKCTQHFDNHGREQIATGRRAKPSCGSDVRKAYGDGTRPNNFVSLFTQKVEPDVGPILLPPKVIGCWKAKAYQRSKIMDTVQNFKVEEERTSSEQLTASQLKALKSSLSQTHYAEVAVETSADYVNAHVSASALYSYQYAHEKSAAFQNEITTLAKSALSQKVTVETPITIPRRTDDEDDSETVNVWYFQIEIVSGQRGALEETQHFVESQYRTVYGCGHHIPPNCLPTHCQHNDHNCWSCTEKWAQIDPNFVKPPECDEPGEGGTYEAIPTNECPPLAVIRTLPPCNTSNDCGELCEADLPIPGHPHIDIAIDNCEKGNDVFRYVCF